MARKYFLLKFISFERQKALAGRERGRERIQSRLHTISMEPDEGLKLLSHEVMTRAETKSQMLNQLSHPGAPVKYFLIKVYTVFQRPNTIADVTDYRLNSVNITSICTGKLKLI